MKRKPILLILVILMVGLITLSGCSKPVEIQGEVIDPDNTFVVLMEMNEFPEGYSDLPVDFINSNQLHEMFLSLNIKEENILVKQDELSLSDLMDSFEWIDQSTNEDSTVFFYVAAHGTYIRKDLAWNALVPKKWNALAPKNKILILDCCMAGEFIEPFLDEPSSGITYGVTSADELGWWGVEEEGLPIIGSIWVHYFVESVFNPDADVNEDGNISFTEAANFSNPLIQEYMADEVFAVDEFLSGYQNAGFDPMIKDGYPNPVFSNQIDSEILMYTIGK